MFNPITLYYLMAAAVILLIGLSKGGLGGGLGAVATPLMVLVAGPAGVPPDQVVGLLLPILILADIFAVSAHWRKWERRLVVLLLPGAVVGVTIGTLFITNAPTERLRTVLGFIILIFAVYKLFEKRLLGALTYRSRKWHGALAGTVSGFSSALAHSGSPPVSMYLVMQELTPRTFVATTALFFAVVNLIKVPYYYYAQLFNLELLRPLVWLLPLVPIGVWLGRWGATRIDRQTFENIIVILLAINGILLILI